ncbi:MAG TPA: sigma factor, partial [Amaricoccus sp.]|nr:sigma factor [Amaricoccus sp.]
SYGKLVAWLAARTRDDAEAEDAHSGAFAAALADWPRRGRPANPEAWLFTVARERVLRRGDVAGAGGEPGDELAIARPRHRLGGRPRRRLGGPVHRCRSRERRHASAIIGHSGRTSMMPWEAPGQRAAQASAASRSGTSIR